MATVSLTLGDIKMMETSLRECVELHLPIVPAFKIAKIVKAVSEELKLIEEKRKELVTRLGTKEEDGSVVVGEDNIQEFQNEFKTLLDVKVDLDVPIIRLSEFGNDVEMPSRILIQLEPFISE